MVNLLMMTGQEAQKSSREGKRGGIKETTETGSTMQEFEPVAPLCLPGLYKSKQLPSIDAEGLSVSASSESDRPAVSSGKARKASPKHHFGSETALAGERASLRQISGQRSLKPHGPAVNMQRQAKSQGKHSLPGRLRKKLAKEQGRGGRALCKRGKGNP